MIQSESMGCMLNVGMRAVGCCRHTCAVIWYLAIARYAKEEYLRAYNVTFEDINKSRILGGMKRLWRSRKTKRFSRRLKNRLFRLLFMHLMFASINDLFFHVIFSSHVLQQTSQA